MKFRAIVLPVLLVGGLLSTAIPGAAHHSILGKFDDGRAMTLEGIVTMIDWRNPHVHIFMNVADGPGFQNWAVEIESPGVLRGAGWSRESLRVGDAITVDGMAARNDTRQVWGNSIVMTETGRLVMDVVPMRPPDPLASRPTPRWPDGQPRLGPLPGGVDGYWAYPSANALMQTGANVAVDEFGLLENINDSDRVAPLQPWALELYEYRQSRQLRDDPTFLNCKPPAGPRQYHQPEGFQLIEDRERERVFVLVGSGNRNFHIMFLDGRDPVGQVGGDDDNPLYYGRSVGQWEGDTLVVETSSFIEDFWFSNGGLPHTDALTLTERFTRPDFDTLRYEVTIDDPGAYTRSWTSSWTLRWVAGQELPMHFCQENRP